MTANDRRREIALAGLDAYIDVLSAWRGRYEDDHWHAGIDWITKVIPECERSESPWRRAGWLCAGGTARPGVWWELTSVFRLGAACGSFRGEPFTSITRGQFRDAARRSGVALPSRNATLFLEELKEPCPVFVECDKDRRPHEPGYFRCTACGAAHRTAIS